MLVHQKAPTATSSWSGVWATTCRMWPTEPRADIDDWHWTTRSTRPARSPSAIEHFRSLYPLNTGAIVWQLNDNWPVVSWAAVDDAGIRKPLWYALKRCTPTGC